MQGKEQKRVPSPSPSPSHTEVEGFQTRVTTNTNATSVTAGKHCSTHDSETTFYTKLTELLESSGLSLIFNVRETLLDLYLFYLEVTRRGGYHQVGQDKKWDEVVSALKLEGSNVKLSAQLEKLYALLLYRFEQLYYYRSPAKKAAASGTIGPLTNINHSTKRKWDSLASLSQSVDIKDGQTVTKMCNDYSCQMTGKGYVEQPVLLMGPSNDEETKKRRGAPRRQRNAYQIFLKQECARLRTCNQSSNGKRILHMAIEAWKKMSEIEKQPYVEESKKDKERCKEAMSTHNKQQSTQNTREEKRPSLYGDYHVTLQPEADNSLVSKATVGLALKMVEKASNDPLHIIDWDAYCSLDLPTEESK